MKIAKFLYFWKPPIEIKTFLVSSLSGKNDNLNIKNNTNPHNHYHTIH